MVQTSCYFVCGDSQSSGSKQKVKRLHKTTSRLEVTLLHSHMLTTNVTDELLQIRREVEELQGCVMWTRAYKWSEDVSMLCMSYFIRSVQNDNLSKACN